MAMEHKGTSQQANRIGKNLSLVEQRRWSRRRSRSVNRTFHILHNCKGMGKLNKEDALFVFRETDATH
ncbi:hypothetical protein CEXT_429721 [Caerostris extrusa]|uniref:Uncharacterized protein n=1 Tax=Caerostris extrusa TaxID=172846 RepID=A0AAV4Q088_CAEEX|nr:hypothetical protein CEXT_429721 [Caerostris extrusa]